MAELWIESIGLIAGGLGIVAWIPQIKEVWVHKKHDGISLTTFSIVTVALWSMAGRWISLPEEDGHYFCEAKL